MICLFAPLAAYWLNYRFVIKNIIVKNYRGCEVNNWKQFWSMTSINQEVTVVLPQLFY